MEETNVPIILLGEHDVAEMLGVSVAIVRRWRLAKQGPQFLRLGRSVWKYRPEDVHRWLDTRQRGGEMAQVG